MVQTALKSDRIRTGRADASVSKLNCCCEWECSHWTQATSKDLHANLCARVSRPVWIGHTAHTNACEYGHEDSPCVRPPKDTYPLGPEIQPCVMSSRTLKFSAFLSCLIQHAEQQSTTSVLKSHQRFLSFTILTELVSLYLTAHCSTPWCSLSSSGS